MQILTVDFQSPDAPQQFAKSLKETGFAVIKNHPVPFSLFEKVQSDWEQFFAQNMSYKKQFWYDIHKHDGYFPTETSKDSPIKDLKEFYHIVPEGRVPPGVGPETWGLRQALFGMGKQLLQWLQDQAPEEVCAKFPMPLPEMMDSAGKTTLRVIHYPPLKGDEPAGAVRAAEHEDINLITVLPAANKPGLEVKGNLDEWQLVECDPGTIVINAGDMLQELSEGYYRSTKHRVSNPEGENIQQARFSTPMFIHPRGEVRLSERYPTAAQYCMERMSEQGLA